MFGNIEITKIMDVWKLEIVSRTATLEWAFFSCTSKFGKGHVSRTKVLRYFSVTTLAEGPVWGEGH